MYNQLNLLGEEQGTPLFSQPPAAEAKPATVGKFLVRYTIDGKRKVNWIYATDEAQARSKFLLTKPAAQIVSIEEW